MTKVLPWIPRDSRKTSCCAYLCDNKGRMVLMIYKNSLLSIPAGKRERNESYVRCLSREMLEELDILILSYNELFTYRTTEAEQHVYAVVSYAGSLVNHEPKKHKYVGWYDEIQAIDAVSNHDITDICLMMMLVHAHRHGWKRLLDVLFHRYSTEIQQFIRLGVINDPHLLIRMGVFNGKRS